jgi:hypothetical protein
LVNADWHFDGTACSSLKYTSGFVRYNSFPAYQWWRLAFVVVRLEVIVRIIFSEA